jgi:hypothetical protein
MLFYILFILITILIILKYFKKETFQNNSKIKIDNQIYDQYYVNIYDELYDSNINTLLCKKILNYLDKNDSILCINSKNGHILNCLSKYNITGIENNTFFINECKHMYNINTKYGNISNISLFKKNMFDHIILPINIFQNIDPYISISKYWLNNNGLLFVPYLTKPTKYTNLINNSPSLSFLSNYKVEYHIKHNIIKEIIKTNFNHIKRINILNYKNINHKHISQNYNLKFINKVNIIQGIDLLIFQNYL